MSAPASLSSRANDTVPVGFREATWLWTKVAFLSFGGAAGQIALLHRFIVDERRWLDERSFLNALNFCTLLPGPEAQQLATYIGWRLHGIRGGLVAGGLFILPGALIMLALSLLYSLGRELVWVDGLFLGIKAAVLAVIAEALHRIGKRALKSRTLVLVSIATFFGLVVLNVPFPLLIVGAAAFGAVASRYLPGAFPRPAAVAESPAPASAATAPLAAAAACTLAWWLPVGLAALALGPSHILVELGLFFSKLAVITFGGAYAVLAYLAEASVERGWVSPGEMIEGLGLAETTPGPTILVNQFVGYLAALRHAEPFSPTLAAVLGAIMTTWVTFMPSFVWIFAGAPYLERLTRNPLLSGALAAITAAVVGIVASLALNFGLHLLFGEVGSLRWGFTTVPWPDVGTIRPGMAALSVLAAVLLFRLHLGIIKTVAAMAIIGLVVRLLFGAL
jgi:chromate transporter